MDIDTKKMGGLCFVTAVGFSGFAVYDRYFWTYGGNLEMPSDVWMQVAFFFLCLGLLFMLYEKIKGEEED